MDVKPQYLDDYRRLRHQMELSKRHRLWGYDCPAVDLDMIEYDNGQPVAVIEYSTMRKVGDDGSVGRNLDVIARTIQPHIGLFVARYNRRWNFAVDAVNQAAFDITPWPRHGWMPELDYVTWLYSIRGRELPDTVRWAITAA